MQENEPTLNELINSIHNHLETIKTTESKAMIAASSNKHSHQQRINSTDNPVICKYCKKIGHEIAECRKLKHKKEKEQSRTKPFELAMMAATNNAKRSLWIADSGSSLHMTGNKSWISNYRTLIASINIRLGDDRIIQTLGFGEVKTTVGPIKNVHFVPQIKSNLFSLVSATDQGTQFPTDKYFIKAIKNNQEVFRAKRIGKTYQMNFDVIQSKQATCAAATLEEWHQRFGHISTDAIKRMNSLQTVRGLDIKHNSTPDCEDCALNKCHATSHPTRSTPKVSKPEQALHFDTAGPARPPGIGETRFMVLCKDEFSGFRMTKCTRQSTNSRRDQANDDNRRFRD